MDCLMQEQLSSVAAGNEGSATDHGNHGNKQQGDTGAGDADPLPRPNPTPGE